MKILISSDLIGTSKHLIFNGESYSWSSSYDSESWIFGKRERTFKSLEIPMEAVEHEMPAWPDPVRVKIFNQILKESDTNIPWHKVLGDNLFKECVQDLVDCLWLFSNKWNDTYYMQTLPLNTQLLMSLKSALVDKSKIKKYKSSGLSSQLSTFVPNDNSEIKTVVYDQFGSQTGRLTVKSGPQILTLKKEMRDIFKSRYEGGNIVEIDFTSIEPRIALKIAGDTPPKDVYSYISSQMFDRKYHRDEVKLAVLASLYGSKSIPGIDIEWSEKRQIVKSLREKFKIKKIEEHSFASLRDFGYIQNIFGRKMTPRTDKKHVLYNNIIQSSAVDASLLGFRSLLSSIDGDFTPLFVIHDAIIIDLSKKSLKSAMSLESISLSTKEIEIDLPIKLKILS